MATKENEPRITRRHAVKGMQDPSLEQPVLEVTPLMQESFSEKMKRWETGRDRDITAIREDIANIKRPR